MRVGFFTYGVQHAERLTGIPRYTTELTRALRQLDPALEIVLLNPYPDSQLAWYREFETAPLPGLGRLPAALSWGNVALHRAARRARLDLLHDPCGLAPFLAPAGQYARVVTVHDVFARVLPRTQDPLMRLLYATLLPLTRHTADAVITVSEASRRDLQTHLGLPPRLLHVTPLGVTLPARPAPPASDPPDSAPYLLYVGNLTPRKNLRRVIQAFSQVRVADPTLTLKITGPTFWGGDAVSALAQATPGVQLTGFVSDEALDRLYRGAQALIFPSLYEGFGLPALEAMARGCPVITANLSSLPEVVGEAGLLVDPYSVPAIAAAMTRLRQDPALRARLVQAGPPRAAQFSWQTTAERTLVVYRQVLA